MRRSLCGAPRIELARASSPYRRRRRTLVDTRAIDRQGARRDAMNVLALHAKEGVCPH